MSFLTCLLPESTPRALAEPDLLDAGIRTADRLRQSAAGIGTGRERSKRESRRFGAERRVGPLPIRAAHDLTFSIH